MAKKNGTYLNAFLNYELTDSPASFVWELSKVKAESVCLPSIKYGDFSMAYFDSNREHVDVFWGCKHTGLSVKIMS